MTGKDREKDEVTGIPYTDVSNVETQENFLTAEEFPEGGYGAAEGKNTPVENKSTPWKKGQRKYSAFNYEFKSLHQNLPRQFPGAHPTHDDPDTDDPDTDTQTPYEDSE